MDVKYSIKKQQSLTLKIITTWKILATLSGHPSNWMVMVNFGTKTLLVRAMLFNLAFTESMYEYTMNDKQMDY